MRVQVTVLALLMLLSACARPAPYALPRCWAADAFTAGQQVAGEITLVISHHSDDLQVPENILMTPLDCERGSFLIDNPADFDLPRFSRPFREGDDKDANIFGTAVNATIVGTVRVDHEGARAPDGRSASHIVLTKVENLQPISRPAWWRK